MMFTRILGTLARGLAVTSPMGGAVVPPFMLLAQQATATDKA